VGAGVTAGESRAGLIRTGRRAGGSRAGRDARRGHMAVTTRLAGEGEAGHGRAERPRSILN
jgi:hypothetical protein